MTNRTSKSLRGIVERYEDTMTNRTCAVMFSISSNPFTDAPEIPCGLPIEGYGPCAYEAGPYRCEVEAEHHLQGVNHITHGYQPSQWRHVSPALSSPRHLCPSIDVGHEATPVRETV